MPGKLTEGVDEETKPKGGITQDPKPDVQPQDRLITSQNDTAPKHSRQRYYRPSREALEAGAGHLAGIAENQRRLKMVA